MKKNSSIITLLVLLTFTVSAFSQESNWKRKITPFSNLGTNSLQSISGKNLYFHLGGIAASYGIIESGLDKEVHNYFSRNRDLFNSPSTPAVYIGYTVPVSLGVGLYAFGLYKDNPKAAAAGCAVLQSSLIAFSENCLLKTFTGRPNPDAFEYTSANNQSSKFRFGFMRGGIHYGWPSGHMAVTTAVVSSLTNFYFDNTAVKVVSWASWAYMLVGVISHDGNTMHWTSDVVAGSLMGYAIGSTVGANFRKLYEGTVNDEKTALYFNPQINSSYVGINAGLVF